jgi:hypothetical protein
MTTRIDASAHEIVAWHTKERVLQAEEAVFLVSGHLVQWILLGMGDV